MATFETITTEAPSGALAFDDLLARINDIAASTIDRFGEGHDGIDYAAIGEEIAADFARHVTGADAQHRAGFLAGLAAVMTTAALGNSLVSDWSAVGALAWQQRLPSASAADSH